MVKEISNITVSYPDVYVENMWSELYSRRDKLLNTTDWTQLNDSQLTRESFNEWRMWRTSLKKITSNDYSKVQDAILALEDIKKLQPISEFKETYDDNDAYEQIEIINSEIQNIKLALSEINNVDTVDVSLNDVKTKARMKLKTWYEHNLSELSYAPISIIFERCSQAIDYIVSTDITKAPLVENHATIHNMNFEEISNNFINNKKLLIQRLKKLDNISEQVIHAIHGSKTIDELNASMSKYNID